MYTLNTSMMNSQWYISKDEREDFKKAHVLVHVLNIIVYTHIHIHYISCMYIVHSISARVHIVNMSATCLRYSEAQFHLGISYLPIVAVVQTVCFFSFSNLFVIKIIMGILKMCFVNSKAVVFAWMRRGYSDSLCGSCCGLEETNLLKIFFEGNSFMSWSRDTTAT